MRLQVFIKSCGLISLLFFASGCLQEYSSNDGSHLSSYKACFGNIESNFKQNVLSVMNTHSCKSCHSGQGSASGTRLKFTTTTDVQEQVHLSMELINTDDVNASPLLLKPTNSVAHGGGQLFNVGSEAYNRLKAYADHVASTDKCSGFQSESQCIQSGDILQRKLRRLTEKEIKNTITDVFGNINDRHFPSFQDGNPTIGMASENNYLDVSQQLLLGWHDSLEQIITIAMRNNDDLNSCGGNFTPDCQHNVLPKYATRLLRHPLSDTETTDIQNSLNRLTASGGNGYNKVRFFLKAVLMNPLFFYRTEIGLNEESLTSDEIDSYEIASFLSFSLWDSPPDETLYSKAENGSLKNRSVVQSELNRMLQDPRAKNIQRSFFTDFLKLDRMPHLVKSGNAGSISSTEKNALSESIYTMVEQPAETPFIETLLTSDFPVNSDLNRFYGTNVSSQNLVTTPISSSERVGLLNHPAFLAIHANPTNSGIVQRGVYVLEQLLCHSLGNPPDNISETDELPEDFNEDLATSREVLHVKHSSQPACVSCHQHIDNVGGGLENFDSLGRFRLTEKENIQIDASGELSGVGSLNISYNDSPDMTRKMVQSNQFQACLNKRFFEYITGEKVTSKNECTHNQLNQGEELSVQSYMSKFTDSSLFKVRRRED